MQASIWASARSRPYTLSDLHMLIVQDWQRSESSNHLKESGMQSMHGVSRRLARQRSRRVLEGQGLHAHGPQYQFAIVFEVVLVIEGVLTAAGWPAENAAILLEHGVLLFKSISASMNRAGEPW